MKYLVRKKVKGDHRIGLSCADRKALVNQYGLIISEDYIVKIFSEGNRKVTSLSQHILDQLARTIDHADWNEFLRNNPVPEGQYEQLLKAKFKKRLSELVEQRMQELIAQQKLDNAPDPSSLGL